MRSTCRAITTLHVSILRNLLFLEYFLSDIFQGKRRFVKRSEMKKAYAPHIEGLQLSEIVSFIKKHPEILQYMPAEEETPKVGREFICNIVYTIKPAEFTAFVREKEQMRRAKMDSIRNNTVRLQAADYCYSFKSIQSSPKSFRRPCRSVWKRARPTQLASQEPRESATKSRCKRPRRRS